MQHAQFAEKRFLYYGRKSTRNLSFTMYIRIQCIIYIKRVTNLCHVMIGLWHIQILSYLSIILIAMSKIPPWDIPKLNRNGKITSIVVSQLAVIHMQFYDEQTSGL